MAQAPQLTARDACLIIKAGKESGARTLKFRGLEVEFGPVSPAWPEPIPFSPQPTEGASSEDAEIETIKKELAMKQSQLDEMPVTDPLAYEELIAQDELRNDTDGADKTDS